MTKVRANQAEIEEILNDPSAGASEIKKGTVEIATQAEVDLGSDTLRSITPNTLSNAIVTQGGGLYEPKDSTILKNADIGVTVQGYDATILVDADIGITVADANHTHTGVYEPAFSKNSGFNLNLGTTSGTVSEGNHLHTIGSLSDVVFAVAPATNEILKYNGTNWVNTTNINWITANNGVNFTTPPITTGGAYSPNIAIGDGASATSTYDGSIAIGNFTTVNAYRSIAIGENISIGSGTNAVSIGYKTTSASWAVAIGNEATSDAHGQVTIGASVTSAAVTNDVKYSVKIGYISSGFPENKNVLHLSNKGKLELYGDEAQFIMPNYTIGSPLTYPANSVEGGVIYDSVTKELQVYGGSPAGWSAIGAGVTDHTLLTNIGTNTHAQIDTHIAGSPIHFTQAEISITESQISDLQPYLLDITSESIGSLSDVTLTGSPALTVDDVLVYNGTDWLHQPKTSVGTTDHTLLTNIGTNTHAQIDTHIGAINPHNNWVSGNANTLFSFTAVSSGPNSLAIGSNASASGAYSIAVGGNSYAGFEAITLGKAATANTGAISIGVNASATVLRSVAIGKFAQAYAADSIAIGAYITNSTTNSVEIGTSNTNKIRLTSGGEFTTLGTSAQFVFPNYAIGSPATYPANAVEGGVIYDSAAKGLEVYGGSPAGWNAIGGGGATILSELTDVVFGGSPNAALTTNDILKYDGVNWVNATKVNNWISGNGDTDFATGATSGTSSFAAGKSAAAAGNSSIGLGEQASAAGGRSVALGYKAFANADSAITIGQEAKSNYNDAIAIGRNAYTPGNRGMTIGNQSSCTGSYALAIGFNVDADYSRQSNFGVDIDTSSAATDGPYTTKIGYGALNTNKNMLHLFDKGKLELYGDEAQFILPNYQSGSPGTPIPSTTNEGGMLWDSSVKKIKVYDGTAFTAIGGINNLVEDAAPQLGGHLSVNGYQINTEGPASASSPGEDIIMTPGAGGATSGNGGRFIVNTGASPTSGSGGDINLTTGASTNSASGSINLTTGAAGNNGGSIVMNLGFGTAPGHVIIKSSTSSGYGPPELRMTEIGANGQNYVAIVAPSNIATTRTWILPEDDPTVANGRFLTTNANGELSFSSETQLIEYNETGISYGTTGAISLDVSLGTYFYPTATTTGIITFSFTNPAIATRVTTFTLELLGAGNNNPVWPASVTWVNGVVPSWSTGTDIVSFFTRDNGTTWYGIPSILNDNTIDLNNADILNARSITFNSEVVNTGAPTGSPPTDAITIDWTLGQKQKLTVTVATTLTLTAPTGPSNITLKIVNGGTGTITWPATVKWQGGTQPTWTASGTDIASFYFDGTNYYGMAGLDFL